jgi:hypothetical protein
MSIIRRSIITGAATLGVLFGALLLCSALALAAAPEAPEVTVESPVPATTAIVHGVLNPHAAGEAGTYEFLYKASKTGECKGGSHAPATPGASGGGEHEEVGEVLSSLSPNTEYAVCVRVENGAHEEAVSPAVTFRTALPPETPKTEAASAITGTTATLHGVLNPLKEGEAGTYEFTYQRSKRKECNAEHVAPEPAGSALGHENEAVSAPVTGLEGSTEYGFCVVATNKANESATGPVLTFKTPAAAPVVVEERESTVTPFVGILEGSINPERQETEYHFEYAVSEAELLGGKGTPLSEGSPLPGLSEPLGVSAAESAGLEPAETYYYRLVATNATGTTDGPVKTFKTLTAEKPPIEEEKVTGVTQTDAELHALINPNFQITHYQFKIGKNTGYGLGAVPAAEGELGAVFGNNEVGVDLNTEGVVLEPNTEYHYEAVATNETGVTDGLAAQGDKTFLTLPNPPTATTGEASAVTPNSATIAGTVNPGAKGQPAQDETTYWFQYSTDTGFGNQIPIVAGKAGEGESAVPETANLTGLEPDTTYHYRILASNDNAGTAQVVHGEGKTFKTVATPPVLSQVSVEGTSITQSSAVVGALLEAMGLPTRWELQVGSSAGNLQFASAGDTTSSSSLGILVNVESLAPGTRYYYKLNAVNPDGMVESSEGSFTTVAGPNPGSTTQVPTTPLLTIPNNTFPKEETGGKAGKKTTKKLTNHEKLEKALEECKRESKSKRATCKKQAHEKYGSKPKKKHKK